MANGLLQQIANPPQVDVAGSIMRGQGMAQNKLLMQGQREKMEDDKRLRALGLTKAQLDSIGLDLVAAGMMQGESQTKMLQQGLEKAPEGSFIRQQLQSGIDMPPGKERDASIFKGISFLQATGNLPKPEKPKASKTAGQIEREVVTEEETVALREKEYELRKLEGERRAVELKPTMQKILDTSQNAAFASERTANEFDLLVRDFDKLGFKGGVQASVKEFLKDTLGTQDEVSMLRRKFRGIRASQATKNLPPGPASDKDIQLALSGFPPENAPAEMISSFLKGASKLARIDNAFQTFKAEYVSNNRNTAGLIKSWRENKNDLINSALEGTSGDRTTFGSEGNVREAINPQTGEKSFFRNGKWERQ